MKRLALVTLIFVVFFGTTSVASGTEMKKPQPQKKVMAQKKSTSKSAKKPAKKITQKPPVPKAAALSYRIAASQANFSIGETLRGAPFTAVGTTSEVAGAVSLDWAAPKKTKISPVKIDAKTFKTESNSRDFMIRKFILKAEDPGNEFIVFTPKSISGLPKTLKEGEKLSLVISGDLTIAGITKETQFATEATVSKKSISGTASTMIKRGDFNLVVPSVPMVASVDEEVKLSINLNAK